VFDFSLQAVDGAARAGTFTTPHGAVKTPAFMPVGTRATVKGVSREQLAELSPQVVLANTYHLYLAPGADVVEKLGGLHGFAAVDFPMLTDSGGFQVFSLGASGGGESKGYKNKESLVKITEDGVEFRSHLDGSKHFFSPESAMETQAKLGADIVMAFDECAPGDSDKRYARRAMERTHRWAERSLARHNELQIERVAAGKHPQAMFPIVQGVVYDDLRAESAKFMAALDVPGVAVGGLSVGESKEDMYRVMDVVAPLLPVQKPRYVMGIGRPEDLVEAVARGFDLFDCVLPTRLGRHGSVFTSAGTLQLARAEFRASDGRIPVVPELETKVSRTYSLGYLRHLVTTDEMLGSTLLSLHNLEFLIKLCEGARKAVLEGRHAAYLAAFWRARGGRP